MSLRALAFAALLTLFNAPSWAQSAGDPFTISDGGSCPAFHCTPEGTSLMSLDVPKPGSGETVGVLWEQSDALGSGYHHPGVQSCSSDGGDFTCLYTNGTTTALSVNASTLTENFTLDSSVLATSGTNPAVALYGTDKSIIIADGDSQKRIVADSSESSGYRVLWSNASPYSGDGLEVSALTPVQYTANGTTTTVIVVTYKTGEMIAFDPAYGYDTSSSGVINATYDVGRTAASPPIAHGNAIYFVAAPALLQTAVMKKIVLSNGAFSEAASFSYNGTTGASPVYYSLTSTPLIILHVPTGDGDCDTSSSGDHLIAVTASDFTCVWSTALSSSIQVSPPVDPVRGGVWIIPYSTANTLQHVTDAGVIDETLSLSTLLNDSSISSPRFVGHTYTAKAPDDSSVYLITMIGGVSGTGYKYAVVINVTTPVSPATTPATYETPSLLWKAEVDDIGSSVYGAALPLVTLESGKPGLVVSGGGFYSTTGNVVVLGVE